MGSYLISISTRLAYDETRTVMEGGGQLVAPMCCAWKLVHRNREDAFRKRSLGKVGDN